MGSVVVALGVSCSMTGGILLDQGLNPCLLHWQADPIPLSHQWSLLIYFLSFVLAQFENFFFFCLIYHLDPMVVKKPDRHPMGILSSTSSFPVTPTPQYPRCLHTCIAWSSENVHAEGPFFHPYYFQRKFSHKKLLHILIGEVAWLLVPFCQWSLRYPVYTSSSPKIIQIQFIFTFARRFFEHQSSL